MQEPHQGIRSSGRGGFHVCIGACMPGECIREGQWQLRLKAVVRGYSGDSGGGDGDFLARILVYKGEEG
eukprot:scaffold5803_cov40-Attheya_sp.AAC.4